MQYPSRMKPPTVLALRAEDSLGIPSGTLPSSSTHTHRGLVRGGVQDKTALVLPTWDQPIVLWVGCLGGASLVNPSTRCFRAYRYKNTAYRSAAPLFRACLTR
ncbi:hypothetical protein V2G26_011666 [Clonostachys chloroleuca]